MTALLTQPETITARLLANRELLSLDRARLYVAGRARVRTPLGAAEFLGCAASHDRETYDKRLRIALDCLELYAEIFPEEFALSQEPPYSTGREHEFYRLVEKNLFPLPISEGVSIEEHIEREPNFFLPFIPIRGAQKHTWAFGCFDFQEIETAFKVAQVLSQMTGEGGRGWQALCMLFGIKDAPAPLEPTCGMASWTLFTYSCAVEGTPLKHLPLAFHMISYRTGNMWLDLPPLGFIGYEWKGEDVIKVNAAWMQAQEMGERIAELTAWLDEDPKARIVRAVELWNKAIEAEAATGFAGVRAPYGQLMHVQFDGAPLREIYGDEIPLFRDLRFGAALLQPETQGRALRLLEEGQ